jgi:hypothetical protein
MDGHIKSKAWGLGPAPTHLSLSFATNGTSNPVATTFRYPVGCKPTVTRSATGTYSVVLPQGCGMPSQPQAVIGFAQFDAAADWFEVGVIGETTLTTTARAITVFTHKAGTATDVAAAAGSRVNLALFFDDSTGA